MALRIERRPAKRFPQQGRELVVVFYQARGPSLPQGCREDHQRLLHRPAQRERERWWPSRPDWKQLRRRLGARARRRKPIHTGDLTRGLDYCRVWLAARTVGRGRERRRQGRELIVSVPLTQAGAVHLDEESKAYGLLGVLFLASELAARSDSDDFPTPTELIAAFGDRGPLKRQALAPLNSPLDTPPAGRLGYYSDGHKHAAAVILSATGRRLLIEFESEGVLRTTWRSTSTVIWTNAERGVAMGVGLPPGPSYPVAVQGLGFVKRPLAFLERCRARYGGRFTLRLPLQPPVRRAA